MNEFEFITTYLQGLSGPESLALKDDVAIWRAPSGQDALITMDTLAEGVHFPDGKFDAELAQKLLRVNISDLIAKGAKPAGYFLSLALSQEIKEQDLAHFVRGLAQDQDNYNLRLWGGDTTRTKAGSTLTITMLGTAPKGKAVRRLGAKPGDLLCVTGRIGDAYLGLKTLLGELDAPKAQAQYWQQAYHVPEPPFALRASILKYASAALDISDGLMADAAHLADVSDVGAEIFLTTIPLSHASTGWVLGQADHKQARLELATGGDDYQVLMSVPKIRLAGLKKQAQKSGIDLTVIGQVIPGSGIKCCDSRGNEIAVKKSGYTHF